MPARRVNPTLERWFAAAGDQGWGVERKIKRATLTDPTGDVQVIVSLTPGDADLRRFANRMHTYGVTLPEPKTDQRLAKLSVPARSAMVWEHMRRVALDRDYAYVVQRGVGYYNWNAESLCDVIQTVFPTLTEYEPEKRPSKEGQRPIYDYLRSRGVVVSLGHQAENRQPGDHSYLVSDVWDVEAVRQAAAAERRRPAPEPVEPPSVIRGRTVKEPAVPADLSIQQEPEPTPPLPDEPAPQPVEPVQMRRMKEQLLDRMVEVNEATDRLERQITYVLANVPDEVGDTSELAYWQTEAEQQKRRAETSEQMIRDIRHAVETLPIGQAFGRIIEIVPPSPLAR